MKIKVEPETEYSQFTFNRGDEKFEILKNCKKELNTDNKEFCRKIKSEPLDHEYTQINIYENSILTNNTNCSSCWSNSGYNSEIDYKKEEIKEEKCDIKQGIKSECKVVLKRLNFKVKTEDYQRVYLADQYEDLKPVKNEFFIPDRNSNRNNKNVQIKKKEESEQYDIEHNSKRQKENKCNANKTKFIPSIRKHNKIERKIKRKYFRAMRSSHSKQNHKCDLCKQTFVNKKILQTHLFFHIGKKPFNCTTCNQKFSWQFLLRRHLKEHNTEKQIEIDHKIHRLPSSSKNRKVSERKHFQCDICDKLLSSKGHLERHHRTLHQESYYCKICKKQFQTKPLFRRHQISHSEDRPFKCDICDKGYKTRYQLKRHGDTHSDECKYFCQVCNKSFKTKRIFGAHVLIHNDEIKHCCQICNKYFKRKCSLRRHEKTHEDRSDKYFCEVCKKGFKRKSSVDRHHIAQHQNMFVCSYCSKPFKTKNMLKVHKKIHIQKCDICKKEFSCKLSLNLHRRIHFDMKPYICEVCNRRFISASALKRHQSSHNKDNLPYVCEVCKKRFNTKSHLLRHQPAHQRKEHFCSHCKRRFKTEIKLKLHLQFSCSEIHSKRLLYQCNICKQTYGNSFDLEQHLFAYNGQIHFRCDFCIRKFTSKVEFETHKKTAHPPGGRYECKICSKTFRTQTFLNRHMKMNTDLSVMKCDVCGKKFCSFKGLKYHARSHFSQ
ncbi:zinc finger protein 11-like [Centruroides vittatus]|uniref:zinc finger protein 11-like n=1 Tax=Centruroides vittatus TaxID=120091 RepID=UPI00350F1192